jgi:fibronectin-binding autotransporter adhesin
MNRIVSKRRTKSAILAAAVGLVPLGLVRADTVNWTGVSSSGDGASWLSPLNWTDTTTSGNSVPTDPATPGTGLGDQAIFSDTGLGSNFALTIASPGTSLGGIVLGTSTGTLSDNLAINGSAVTLFGYGGSPAIAITRDETTTGTQTISAPIVLDDTSTTAAEEDFNINGTTGLLTLSGVISQANTNVVNFAKNGDGTLTISNASNSYKGSTIINDGTLITNTATSIPVAGGNIELGAISGSANANLLANTGTIANNIDVRAGSTGTLTIGEIPGGNAPTFSGILNLYNNVTLSGASGGAANPVTGAGVFSGIIQTAPTVASSNVTIRGTGFTYLSTAPSTYRGTTTVSSGILMYGAVTGANTALTTVGTTSSGSMTVQLNSVAGLATGQAVSGLGVPLATSTATEDTISGINGNTVTLTQPFSSTLGAGTTLDFGTANPLGLSTTPIVLGDANTQANNSIAGLFAKSLFTFSRPITVSSFPTTGGYYLGTVQSALAVLYTGQVTLNQSLSILAETASPAAFQNLTLSGGIVSGGGLQTVTFGNASADLNTFGTPFIHFAGNAVVSTLPIADGAGQMQVVVNAGVAVIDVPCTYTGSTTLNTGGTLQLLNTGAINSPSINVNGGTLQIANGIAGAPYVFTASQKVYGAGTINGGSPITGYSQFNGTLQVGETNNVPVASPSTLNLSPGSILAGTLQEDLTAVNTSDELVFTNNTAGTANLGGTLTITNPNNIPFALGQSYQVLGYGTNAVVGTFSTINLPALPATTPALGWNAAALYSTGTIVVGEALSWNNTGAGAAGDGITWDTSNLNWNNGAGPSTYTDGSVVTFNDTNNGHYGVSINSPVAPGLITVNTANTYTFSGSSSIAGGAGLTKTGTGSLILSNTGPNTFGTVVLNQGTLSGTVAGSLSANLIIVNPTGTTGTTADAATLNSNGSIGSATALAISTNSATAIGTVNFNATAETAGSLQGNGKVVLSNAAGTALTLGGANSSTAFSGNITDNGTGFGSLTKVGTGIQTLSGANTYGGGTSFNGGELAVGNAGAIGSVGTLSFGGGALQYTAANTTDYSSRFSTANNQVFSVDTNSQNVTFASNLSSTGGTLTKSGLGTLTLLGNNTYDTGTNINGGVLSLGSAGAIGSTGNITFGGGTLQFSAANTTDYSSRFSSNNNQPFNIDTNGQNVTFASQLTSGTGGSLTKLGVGTLTLSQSLNVSPGPVNVSQGTLTDLVGGAYGSATTINIIPTGTSGTSADAATLFSNNGIASGAAVTVTTKSATAIGSLILVGTSENIGSLAGTGAGIVNLSNSSGTALAVGFLNTNTAFAGSITAPGGAAGGLGSLNKVGSGTLTLSGTNTYGGGTTISAGVLSVGNTAIPISSTPTGVVTFGGGILQYNASTTTDYSSQFSTTGGQSININTGANSVTFGTALNSSGGSLDKMGTGTLILSKAVNLSNGITVNGGTLTSTVAGGFGTGNFVATTNNNSFTLPNFTSNPVSAIVVNSTGAFGSSASLSMDGSGATNTITVNLNGLTESLASLAQSTIGGGTAKLVLNNTAGTVLTFGNSTSTNIDGTIADNGGKGKVVYVGSGTIEIGNTNTFGGGFTQDAGIINTGPARTGEFGTGPFTLNPTGTSGTSADAAALNDLVGAFSVSNAVTINSNSASAVGTLNVATTLETFGSLAGSGIVSLNNAAGTALTTGGNNTNTTFSGSIIDTSTGLTSSVTFAGTGTFTLSGSNTYGGGTAVTKGTLNLATTSAFPAVTNLGIVTGASVVATNHGANPVTVLQVNTLANGGKVDLTNNAMSVQSGLLSSITTQIQTAYSNGTWAGAGGITSSTAAADTTHATALGVIVNNDGSGNPIYSATHLFDGTAPALNDLLVKYTYYGDTDLDGHVTASDYIAVDNGFTMGLSGWNNGDFNYDGKINGDDYTLIDNAFNTQSTAGFMATSAGPAEMIASNTAQIAGVAASVSAVPEPTTFGLIGVGAIGLLSRRRRRT